MELNVWHAGTPSSGVYKVGMDLPGHRQSRRGFRGTAARQVAGKREGHRAWEYEHCWHVHLKRSKAIECGQALARELNREVALQDNVL
jgi:hypothetical protein